LIDGVLALAAAFTSRSDTVPRWWLELTGILGIAVGLFALLWPGITALALITFIGAWATVRGVLEIAAAVQLRKRIEGKRRGSMAAVGIVSRAEATYGF